MMLNYFFFRYCSFVRSCVASVVLVLCIIIIVRSVKFVCICSFVGCVTVVLPDSWLFLMPLPTRQCASHRIALLQLSDAAVQRLDAGLIRHSHSRQHHHRDATKRLAGKDYIVCIFFRRERKRRGIAAMATKKAIFLFVTVVPL